MNVSSGGAASGVSVGSGGTLTVSSGGVVSALTIKNPNDPSVSAEAQVLSGGTLDGTTRIDGGQLILDAGADFQAHASLTIMDSGWLILDKLVQGHHQRLWRIGRVGPDKDQVHRRDDETFTPAAPAVCFRSNRVPMLPTFIWPAATRRRTSPSRAMARTARWSVLSRDA